MTDDERKDRLAYLASIKCVHPEKCLYKISCQKDYERMWSGGTKEKQCLDFVKKYLSKIDITGFIIQKLEKVIENQESTFPDFFIEDGFIEHFQITASKESKKKGSDSKRHQAKHERELRESNEGIIMPRPNTNSSYENLEKSIKTHWESHMTSMNKYLYKNDATTRIFMIEHNEIGSFEMFENVLAYVKCPSVKPRHFKFYSLSHDTEMLDYIYCFKCYF